VDAPRPEVSEIALLTQRGFVVGQATFARTKTAMRIEPDGTRVSSALEAEDGSSRPNMEQLIN
jgi:hypothetical protein